jgi:magnesium transporter
MKRPGMTSEKYLRYILPSAIFGTERTKKILNVNPTIERERKPVEKVVITVFNYTNGELLEKQYDKVEEIFSCKDNGAVSWINIDGIIKDDIEKISEHFGVHSLITEDILSRQQRPKMDEVDNILFCLLNMLYFNDKDSTVEQEQVSIVLGRDFVLTFQEDPQRDVFNPVREKLRQPHSKLRQRDADYLCYSLLDIIVDNYFLVMEKLSNKIEGVEEEVIHNSTPVVMAQINGLRKEMIVLKRNLAPVRDLVNNIIRSESELLHDGTTRYFKDVYDHIVQAYDLSENYRDMLVSLQDLYINNINLKMNEVMKVMAVVTCLLAPATVIGGIFGMNFESIPMLHNKWGFLVSVGLMLIIPVWMIGVFKRRGWF